MGGYVYVCWMWSHAIQIKFMQFLSKPRYQLGALIFIVIAFANFTLAFACGYGAVAQYDGTFASSGTIVGGSAPAGMVVCWLLSAGSFGTAFYHHFQNGGVMKLKDDAVAGALDNVGDAPA